tara:strand:- start:42177 stop:42662 length:486 start_codon:yes stop_codon:yes gene_type:complete
MNTKSYQEDKYHLSKEQICYFHINQNRSLSLEQKRGLRLYDIGSKVNIDLCQISDRLPLDIYKQIKSDPTGKVIDYKMTDATGVGVVVKLNNNIETWFFDYEVYTIENNLSDSENNRKLSNSTSTNYKKYLKSNLERKSFVFIANPINFIYWLKYTTKDIF